MVGIAPGACLGMGGASRMLGQHLGESFVISRNVYFKTGFMLEPGLFLRRGANRRVRPYGFGKMAVAAPSGNDMPM